MAEVSDPSMVAIGALLHSSPHRCLEWQKPTEAFRAVDRVATTLAFTRTSHMANTRDGSAERSRPFRPGEETRRVRWISTH